MKNKIIFLSYCWANMSSANEIDEILQSYEGIEIKRDKRELSYGQDIQEFMNTVRETDHVILLVSEKYLCSVNCMYEVSQIIKDYNYSDKITPVILDGVTIYGLWNKYKYAKYWNDEYDNLNDKIRELPIEDNISLVEELKKIKGICSAIDEILELLNRKQYYTLEQHKQNNFNDIFKDLSMDKIPSKIPNIGEIRNKIEENYETEEVEYNYTLYKLEDMSHQGAKRYSAVIIMNESYNREHLKEFVLKMTEEIKKRKYHRNDMAKNRFLNKEADVVWLSIARDLTDVSVTNWICRTCWTSKELNDNYKPLILDKNDCIKDIDISWNKSYESYKKFCEENQGTKEVVLGDINRIIPNAIKHANIAMDSFEKYTREMISEDDLIQNIQDKQQEVNELYIEYTHIAIPPEDLKKYMNICRDVISVIDNMFLYYSERGVGTWSGKSRKWQMEKAIKKFKELLPILDYERKQIN